MRNKLEFSILICTCTHPGEQERSQVKVTVDSGLALQFLVRVVSVPQNVYRINCEPAEEGQQSLFCGDSDRWWEQTDLTKLCLSSNQLTHLSEDIRLLPALSVLDVSKSSSDLAWKEASQPDVFAVVSLPKAVNHQREGVMRRLLAAASFSAGSLSCCEQISDLDVDQKQAVVWGWSSNGVFQQHFLSVVETPIVH